jgi:hypothetical protein
VTQAILKEWLGCIAALAWEERNVAVDGKRRRYGIGGGGGDDDDNNNGIKNQICVNLSVINVLFSFVLFLQ